MDLEQRRNKLARFQLGCPEEGLLKILQGAVQMAPSAIYVECAPQEFSLSICNPEVVRGGTQLASQFEQVLLSSQETLLRDLAMGLLAFQQNPDTEIWWSRWSGGHPLEVLSLMGTPGKARLRRPYRVDEENVVCFQVRRSTPHGLVRGKVAEGVACCPVPVHWNGKPLCGSLCEFYCLGGGVALRPAGRSARPSLPRADPGSKCA